MSLLDPETKGNNILKRVFGRGHEVSVPWNAENKEKWNEHLSSERNNKLNFLHSFPTVYVLKASNYFTRTHTSLSKEDHRCIDFLKAYWRCISACGRHEVNENCFEEKQDMLECKYQHKSTARYNLMRREYLRQTGKEYNPDVPLAPMHIFPKETTARPKNADNLRGS